MVIRVVLAAILGGLVFFFWEYGYHELGVGAVGMKDLPNEEALLPALKSNVTEPGLYFFPPGDMSAKTAEARQAYLEKYRKGPNGILVYAPSPTEDPITPKKLGTQLALDIVCMLLVGALLGMAAPAIPRYLGRLFFITTCGILAGIAVTFPNWNWYGFPLDYTQVTAAKYIAGYLIAGLVMAAIIRHKPAMPMPPRV